MKHIQLITFTLLLTACANTRTVYRTDLTDGQYFYSSYQPSQNDQGDYVFRDLDGNQITVKKQQYKDTTPFTYKIRL